MDDPNPRPIALVTGASRGIGAAAARELAHHGYGLVLVARSADATVALAAELTQGGAPSIALPTDMRDAAAVRRMVDAVLAHFGRVDLLVSNAGVGEAKSLAKLADEDVAAVLETNLVSQILLTRLLLPQMLERRRGGLIYIGSVAGYVGMPGGTIYAATKYGLLGFATALRRELRRKGIGVTYIAPGFIETEMIAGLRGVPKSPPSVVARAVAAAAARPRRSIIVPWWYGGLIGLERLAPWLADVVLSRVR